MAATKSPQAALFKLGIVTSVPDPGHAAVRFDDLDGMVSQPLKVLVFRAHRDKAQHPPDVGSLVACVVDENLEDGVVLGEVYGGSAVPANGNPDLWFWRMMDGSEFEFDRTTGKLRISTSSDISVETKTVATLTAATEIVLDAPTVRVTNDLTIGGGIAQHGGGNGKAVFESTLETKQDMVASGKSYLGHRHRENGQGNQTDPP